MFTQQVLKCGSRRSVLEGGTGRDYSVCFAQYLKPASIQSSTNRN